MPAEFSLSSVLRDPSRHVSSGPFKPGEKFCNWRFAITTAAGFRAIIRLIAASRHASHSVYGLPRAMLKIVSWAVGQAGLRSKTMRHPRWFAISWNAGNH